VNLPSIDSWRFNILSGGTSGSVLAARLAEDPEISVLVIEAGQHNSMLENTVMVGGWCVRLCRESIEYSNHG
jgi:choline dehydrogenase-like flavoprotein